jgi:hypothetical protein
MILSYESTFVRKYFRKYFRTRKYEGTFVTYNVVLSYESTKVVVLSYLRSCTVRVQRYSMYVYYVAIITFEGTFVRKYEST